MPSRVVWIQPEAPPKPAVGAPCNGCGLCCLAEPCPVGVLVTRRTTGACQALQWSATAARYECGMLTHPTHHLGLPRWLGFLGLERMSPKSPLNRLLRRWSARMIAAGIGCDAALDVAPSPAPTPSAPSLFPPSAPPSPSGSSKENR